MILLHVTYKISLVERRVAQLNSENADETATMLICPLSTVTAMLNRRVPRIIVVASLSRLIFSAAIIIHFHRITLINEFYKLKRRGISPVRSNISNIF